jgi:glycosyltransferase involved in cell wall biosynthesis
MKNQTFQQAAQVVTVSVADLSTEPRLPVRDRTRPGPLRVLYFDHTAQLGGGEIALFNLVRFLDRTQVIPLVVLGAVGPLEDKLKSICDTRILPLASDVAAAKKDGLGIKTLFRLKEVIACGFYILKLARFISKNKVDIVHTNSLKADIIGGFAGRLARRPVIWHVRDRIDNDYLPKAVVRAFRFLCRTVPNYIVVNSRATLSTLHVDVIRPSSSIPSGIELQPSISVVHDGLSLSQPVQQEFHSEAPVIALIGRICPWKGQHIFIDAAAIVHTRFPGARFKIVGACLFGEDDYEATIRQQCAALGLEDVLEFTGFCRDVSGLIRSLDIVVHASTTGEPFGQVIIEGMAASKPVVATNGGGVPEIVIHEETGLLVPMADAAAMADAICRILSDPAIADEMGRKGRERVRKHFTIQQTAERIHAVYDYMASAYCTA